MYVYDRDGKRYIDFSSQLMNVNIGHGDQRVTEAVAAQMRELSYVYPGMITKARGDLGKQLAEITAPNLTKAFFTLGGAEAIENAIKLARVYTGRHKIVSLYQSFHGASYGAMSVGGDPRKFAVDSQAMPGTVHVENPYFYRCPWYSDHARAVRPARRRRHGAHHRLREPRQRGGHHAGRRVGHVGLHQVPARLLEARPRNLRQARHPAHCR